MADMNKVMLIGNLTKDPQIRQLASGTTVGDLRLAVSDKFKNKAGEQVERVCYVDIVVWGKQAEACQQYLTKGSPVLIEGRLQLDEWEKDGQKRSKLRVCADKVEFLSAGKGSGPTSKRSSEPPISEVSDGPPDIGAEDEPPF